LGTSKGLNFLEAFLSFIRNVLKINHHCKKRILELVIGFVDETSFKNPPKFLEMANSLLTLNRAS
jgi:hypothetical protein